MRSAKLEMSKRQPSRSRAGIYRLVKRIPRGRVFTYGGIARELRVRGGARVVGYAMAGCPSGQGIPWHRVVGAGGRLIIGEPYGSLQRRMLESEGVRIRGSRVDMAAYGWAPSRGKIRRVAPGRGGSGIRARARECDIQKYCAHDGKSDRSTGSP
jgi:methylated-DNA-protein-cysteine methyltransferase related protein